MEPLKFWYVNSRGECEERSIILQRIYHGTKQPYYPKPEFLIEGYDLKRQEFRTFAVAKMQGSLFAKQWVVCDLTSFWQRVKTELPILQRNVKAKNFAELMKAVNQLIKAYKTQIPYQHKLDKDWEEQFHRETSW